MFPNLAMKLWVELEKLGIITQGRADGGVTVIELLLL